MKKELQNDLLNCFTEHFKNEQRKRSYLFEGLQKAFDKTFKDIRVTEQQKSDFMFYIKANIRLS